MLTLGLAVIIVLFFLSIWRPWVALVVLLVLQLFGAIVPGVEDVRGLSLIAIGGLLGASRYFLKGQLKGWPLIWPCLFATLFLINFCVYGVMANWGFPYLLAGSLGAYYLASYALRSPRQIIIVALIAIIVGTIGSIVSVAEFRTGLKIFSGSEAVYAARIHAMKRSLTGNPNYLFPFVMPGLFFAFLLCFQKISNSFRVIVMASIAIMTLGVIATLSRGSVIALASIYLTLILLRKGRSQFKSLHMLLVLCIMIVGLCNLFPDSIDMILERFTKVGSIESPGSRGHLMQVGIQKFLDSPIYGSGLGSVYASAGWQFHDGYTGLLGEMGLLGFLLFYAMPFTTLAYLAKLRNRHKRGIDRDNFLPTLNVFYSFMVGMLVLDFFNPILYMKPAFLLIAFTRLFISGWERENKHRGSSPLYEFLFPMRRREVRYHGPMPWKIMPVRKELLENQT